VNESSAIDFRGPRAWVCRWSQFTASVFLMFGLLGVLRTGLGDIADPEGRNLFLFVSHPLTGIAHLALGLVAVMMASRERWARYYLAGTAVFLGAWAVAGLALDGDPNDVVARDPWLIALHAGFAASCVVALALTSRRRSPATAATAPDANGTAHAPAPGPAEVG
jgi:hypothetical protein